MEEMVYGCLVKGRTKYKSQANNFLKNNIWKKLLQKAVSVKDKKCAF